MLAQALALKLDLLGLYGSGIGAESTGLRNITTTANGMNEVDMGTATASRARLPRGSACIWIDPSRAGRRSDNGAPDTAIMSPRTSIKLQKIKTGISSDLTKLVPPAAFSALKKLVSE